jgi:hypothetical protein
MQVETGYRGVNIKLNVMGDLILLQYIPCFKFNFIKDYHFLKSGSGYKNVYVEFNFDLITIYIFMTHETCQIVMRD